MPSPRMVLSVTAAFNTRRRTGLESASARALPTLVIAREVVLTQERSTSSRPSVSYRTPWTVVSSMTFTSTKSSTVVGESQPMNMTRTRRLTSFMPYSQPPLILLTPSIPPLIHRWVHDFRPDMPLGHRTIKVLRALALSTLRSNIATAEADGVVDAEVIREAKVLLATQPLHTAMERRDVAGLKAAITVAEGEAEADLAVIEVSGAHHR